MAGQHGSVVAKVVDLVGISPDPGECAGSNRPASSIASALAFSCGVDSFHTLLFGGKPDLLVAVHGFDVPLADEYRTLAFAASVEAVAKETGIGWTVVRTNVRRDWIARSRAGAGIESVGDRGLIGAR